MDDREYLWRQIGKWKRKINIAKILDFGTMFAAAGGVAAIVFEAVALFLPFYYVHFAAAICFAAGLFLGALYAVLRRVNMERAAMRIDSFGLSERMVTAYGQLEEDGELVRLQRQDAVKHYNRIREQIKISVVPGRRHLFALVLTLACAVGLSLIPSGARDFARQKHAVQKAAKEEEKTLGALMDALADVELDSLTDEQKAELAELMEAMKLSREELALASSWDSLAAAMKKLGYKYEQAGLSLEQAASLLNDPQKAGIANAEALAKAAANRSGQQMASAGAASGEAGGDGGDGDGSSGESSKGTEEGDDSDVADGKGNSQSTGQNGGGKGAGASGSSGSGSGKGSSSGDGGGNGSSPGNGGAGSGTGGSGRGLGSSDTVHDYVSVPNAISDDSGLTGEKSGDADSDYYRQQNGLAWEGEHVSYSSVIGKYADNAYEGIASGRYPSGMESVIKDYFEGLNR